ncbi:unnamed protein product [Caenorhabditis angaria]|uniref:G-protein coupled receptors family 1 profile domain-containing protein n=1 Tax=Caenorhabditis angaria TaxID=860376 RepID=A0A9P1J5R4_9PELO|nr:unnamed protein product [Caenorhabditis angaria]
MSSTPCADPPSVSALLLDGPISSLVIIAGIIGNIYSLKQLFSRSINTAMLVSLTGLAIWDIVLLIAAFFHHALWATLFYFKLRDEPWDAQLVALNGLVECGHITSTWMLIEVTAERFFAVTRPFHFPPVHRKQRRKSYARVVGGLIKTPLMMTALACVITLPCSFEYDLQTCTRNDIQYQEKRPTSLMNNNSYRLFYRAIFLSVSKTFGPFVIITLLTVSTLRSMRKSMDSRASILIAQGQNHLFQADRDKTKSLQAISIMLLGKFLLLRCWPTALALVQMFVEQNGKKNSFDISHFFLLLNSATNSFVFVVVKSAFETRRLKRIRQRQRELVAQHAEQVLCIGKALAGDKMFLLPDMECEPSSPDDESYELQPMMKTTATNSTSSNPV